LRPVHRLNKSPGEFAINRGVVIHGLQETLAECG
jgi:hypothetical protein